MEIGVTSKESNGSVGSINGQPPEFSSWLLEMPPINLWNVELVYLAFGYRNDVRSELDQRWDIRKDINANFSDSR